VVFAQATAEPEFQQGADEIVAWFHDLRGGRFDGALDFARRWARDLIVSDMMATSGLAPAPGSRQVRPWCSRISERSQRLRRISSPRSRVASTTQVFVLWGSFAAKRWQSRAERRRRWAFNRASEHARLRLPCGIKIIHEASICGVPIVGIPRVQ
jgi:hypothetical protein